MLRLRPQVLRRSSQRAQRSSPKPGSGLSRRLPLFLTFVGAGTAAPCHDHSSTISRRPVRRFLHFLDHERHNHIRTEPSAGRAREFRVPRLASTRRVGCQSPKRRGSHQGRGSRGDAISRPRRDRFVQRTRRTATSLVLRRTAGRHAGMAFLDRSRRSYPSHGRSLLNRPNPAA
jgi:hypothetical protein